MYEESKLVAEVRAILIQRIEDGDAVAASWIAQAIISNH